ncbi:PREDICTED: uncharacterized protein LOC109586999 [Amphimedon queenslandica]|uniref:Uncharacterized protein n=1 Tax=Amphimedon queenslandica TaxID=400682 RepID=A0AAN0JPM8_AMPQE|nr:PREDICTED: uncharacterized protein LOC109586999 [Amphimedon queenslandica]|eukprot:XP_019858782.1 PREDICTED: uncharacterized protein LOC109586999 [Amphimedon queenslandica]
MINQISNSDYITFFAVKDKMVFLRKHPKGAIFCILVPITFLLILLLVGIGIIILLSYHSSNPIDQSMEIGDKQSSSALIPLPNNVSSVSLNIPSGVTVFMASFIPTTGIQILQSEIPQSYGHCAPYNVNNGNLPVYLLPGSIMNYDMTVSGLTDSKCPAQLVLLNNKTEYFACNYNSSNVVKACCLTSGTVNVSIRINKPADYYVILVKEDLTISVSSDITVHQVYYNTSHLTTAKDCEQRSHDASCTVNNDDVKKWSCNNTEWLLFFDSEKKQQECQIHQKFKFFL